MHFYFSQHALLACDMISPSVHMTHLLTSRRPLLTFCLSLKLPLASLFKTASYPSHTDILTDFRFSFPDLFLSMSLMPPKVQICCCIPSTEETAGTELGSTIICWMSHWTTALELCSCWLALIIFTPGWLHLPWPEGQPFCFGSFPLLVSSGEVSYLYHCLCCYY